MTEHEDIQSLELNIVIGFTSSNLNLSLYYIFQYISSTCVEDARRAYANSSTLYPVTNCNCLHLMVLGYI